MNTSEYSRKVVVVGSDHQTNVDILYQYTYGGEYIPEEIVDFTEFPVSNVSQYSSVRRFKMSNGDLVRLEVAVANRNDSIYGTENRMYRGASSAIICFNLNFRSEFNNVKIFLEMIREEAPRNVNIFLVGIKNFSLRGNEIRDVDVEEGLSLAEKIGAIRYYEVSIIDESELTALFGRIVEEGFDRNIKTIEVSAPLKERTKGWIKVPVEPQ